MASIENYQENSGNSAKRNGFESANSALEIADQMKSILKEHMGSAGEKTKAEHPLQMSTMQPTKVRQEAEMTSMRKEISTLTQVLTTLTLKMVAKSSRRGGGGGNKTDKIKKDNTTHRNNRARTKQKLNDTEAKKKKQPYLEKITRAIELSHQR